MESQTAESSQFDLYTTLGEIEARYIKDALVAHKGVVLYAANSLGVKRTTLLAKMRRLGITRENAHE